MNGVSMSQERLAKLTEKKSLVAIVVFAVVAFVMIAIGVFAIKTPAVAMCTLVFLEAGIAVMLHNVELWLHGGLVLAEVIAGVLTGRILLIILCAIVYIAATAALQVLAREDARQ